MSVKLEKAYKDELHRALEKCQFIEETLKMCLLSALEIARIQLSPHFPLKYKAEDISNLPLGPLVKAFSKINNDTTLHADLQKITKDRNQVAHRSLLFTIGELDDEAHMTEATLKMKSIVERATEIHHRVLDVRYELNRSASKVRRGQGKGNP
ncbi:MAG: hypothetical protein Q8K68_09220 [Nitrospirota bacterium]|nr:hypothetical protein [Nitrospirota bacterium]